MIEVAQNLWVLVSVSRRCAVLERELVESDKRCKQLAIIVSGLEDGDPRIVLRVAQECGFGLEGLGASLEYVWGSV